MKNKGMDVRRIKARLLTIQFSVKFPESVPRQSFVAWVAELERCLQSQLHLVHPEQTRARHTNKKKDTSLIWRGGEGRKIACDNTLPQLQANVVLVQEVAAKDEGVAWSQNTVYPSYKQIEEAKITRHHLKKAHGPSLCCTCWYEESVSGQYPAHVALLHFTAKKDLALIGRGHPLLVQEHVHLRRWYQIEHLFSLCKQEERWEDEIEARR